MTQLWPEDDSPFAAIFDLALGPGLEQDEAPSTRTAPADWEPWLREMFPRHVSTFADHHRDLWEWVWAIVADQRPAPLVEVLARGGGKSTSAELATVAVGVRGRRRYAWYIRETQDQADKSVENIGALLEGSTVAEYYPGHAQRLVGKFGNPRGWRRNRLRTAGGFTIDAMGLDSAARGAKVEDQRPDLIILDDIDGKFDSDRTTKKKLETLTDTILPAGAPHLAVLAIQNLIIPNGVFSRLVDGRADFLVDRQVIGPVPALRGLRTEVVDDAALGRRRAVIVAGTPTWSGQSVEACQAYMDTFGLRAFMRECQHEVKKREGALWREEIIGRLDKAPPLKRVVVGVDPSGGAVEIGVIVAGIGFDGRGYVLADLTQPGSEGPLNWGRAAVRGYDDHKADRIAAEANFGGDMVESNIRVAGGNRRLAVKLVRASRGKAVRAEPVAALYEDGLVDHVGTFPELEAELTGWVPGDPDSPNRLDALVWCFTELFSLDVEQPRVEVLFPSMGRKKAS